MKGYVCPDFTIEFRGIHNTSGGNWAACRECAELVDAGKPDELVQRSYEKFRHAEKDEFTLEFLKALHREFWRLMTGPEGEKTL